MKQAKRLALSLLVGSLMAGLFPLPALAEPTSAPPSTSASTTPQAPSVDPTSTPTSSETPTSGEATGSQDPTVEPTSSPSTTPPLNESEASPDPSETSPQPSETPTEPTETPSPSDEPSQTPPESPATTPTIIGVDRTDSGVELTNLAIKTNNDLDSALIAHALSDRTEPFSLLALSWAGLPADAEARVRALSDSGWTDWIEIHTGPGESLVGNDSRQSSEAMWMGISHRFELEITGTGEASDIQVTLVHSTAKPVLLKANTRANATNQSPYVYVQQPSMVSRASWGAMAQDDCGPELYDQTVLATAIHHTAGTNDYSAADVYGILRSIQAYHEVTLKWCDIGYNFLVDKFGTIYEGRGGGVSIPIHGAHSGEWNSNTTGISLIMNTESHDPSTAVLDSVAKVVAWKLANNYRDPLGKVTIANKTIDVIFGHGDVQATACPGKYMKAKMPTLRTKVSDLIKAVQSSPIKEKWQAMGTSSVGQPYQLETSIADGRYTTFTSGYRIYWSEATGAVPVWGPGALGSYYISTLGPLGKLGFPVRAETQLTDGTWYQAYEEGWVTWAAGIGINVHMNDSSTTPETAAIQAKYTAMGGASSYLGAETAPPGRDSTGVYKQTFRCGVIYWSAASGAQPVYTCGSIGATYVAMGGPTSYLGYPTAGEGRDAQKVYKQTFQNGNIYWSGSSVVPVYTVGGIGITYLQMGGPASYLGYPTAGEGRDSRGVYKQTFESGIIYWSSTGAQPVYTKGAIGMTYVNMGGPSSHLGYPTGGEGQRGGSYYQPFQYGRIIWGPSGISVR